MKLANSELDQLRKSTGNDAQPTSHTILFARGGRIVSVNTSVQQRLLATISLNQSAVIRMTTFASAIFVSAFLLFQVQPLIGKFILPWFGGSPAVWTTCMLFFQVTLFLGYAYAHATSRWLSERQQRTLHLALIAVALVMLPIVPNTAWKPVDSQHPTGRILLLLASTVGLSYFVLSATGPLLQAWYSRVCPGSSPYRLYALSNFGSLLALISYPLIVEPLWPSTMQASVWSGLFLVFALLCSACAIWAGQTIALVESRGFPHFDGAPLRNSGSECYGWCFRPAVA